MEEEGAPPTPLHRAAAVASLVALLVAVFLLVYVAIDDPTVVLGVAVLIALAVGLGWNALTHRGTRRLLATIGALGAMVVSVVVIVVGGDSVQLIVSLASALLSVPLARYSLGRTHGSLSMEATPGTPVPAAARPVLIMNPKSGGGKAEDLALADECRARGIEPVILREGDDLVQLAEDAIARGADVIGMAGGDGSQALVAAIAAEQGIPLVVVPAGTRNHFALDLGLDRDAVVGALDAFGPAVERRIDLAEVNGRIFVNNVSLGAYARVVQSEDYRDAKLATTLDALPGLLGPDATPADLRWTGPDGVEHQSAHLILVSNNRYSLRVGAGGGTRDRLDDGELGIVVLEIPNTVVAVELAALVALRRPEGAGAIDAWSATTFEVDASGAVPIGIDGEAMELDPPVVFTVRPGALRVRIPEDAPGYAPAAIAGQSTAATVSNVWRVVRGKAPLPLSAG